jgi:hypothetical protein
VKDSAGSDIEAALKTFRLLGRAGRLAFEAGRGQRDQGDNGDKAYGHALRLLIHIDSCMRKVG